MNFFLDTDICVFALRGTCPSLMKNFQAARPDRIKVPSMVVAELFSGACKSSSPLTAQKAVDVFLEPYEIIPFDRDAAEAYARIRLELEQKGSMIGPNDLVIAATVLSRHGTLITHNSKEFSRVAGLPSQDWTV